ncbi:MAG: CCA tRNA nucleotidyltransferase [Lachnospiraceae bacterium]|nr:CCA tRNA nucleotidyltransferase [Lachnospiraceae bacterium]
MKITMPKAAKTILNVLRSGGFEGYIVGGCVRDALLGRTPNDWDVTTNATPEEIKSLFPKTYDTGIQHGTVTVRMYGDSYEVTTYRVDGDYSDSRHPDSVTFTRNLAEDLKRRDFTINAMAYNDIDGLVDLFGGKEDLDRRVIRAVGNASDRFTEDALRIMRCIRFAAQLDFEIEHDTYLAAVKLSDRIRFISAERVREELLKILDSDHPDYVRKLDDIGAMDSFYVEYRAHRDEITKKLLAMPNDRILRLTALLNHTGRTIAESYQVAERFFDALKFDNDTKNAVLHIIRFSETLLTTDRYQLRLFLNAAGEQDALRILTYMELDRALDMSAVRSVVEDILASHECTCLKEMALSGKDLIRLGMKPGREMGELLMSLLAEVLKDPSLNRKEVLEEKAREKIGA